MENLPRNLEKDVNTLTLPNPSKRVKRWTLLFVGNHGKTISINRFKGFTIISIFFLIILILATVFLFFLFKNEREQNQNLQSNLAQFRQQLVSLKNEKEVLMARLIVAKSNIESSEAKKEEKQQERISDDKSLIVTPEEKKSDVTDIKKNDLSAKTQTEEELTTPKIDLSEQPENKRVKVDSLNIYHKPYINTLIVEVKLRNIGQKTEPVSGDVVVILKDDEVKMDNWITVPAGAIISEQNPRKNKGHTFSIYRFVVLTFKVKGQTSPDKFKTASVYVFSQKGDLLLKKDFPIKIKSSSIPTPKNYLLCMMHNAQ